jgi:hypothetical protein
MKCKQMKNNIDKEKFKQNSIKVLKDFIKYIESGKLDNEDLSLTQVNFTDENSDRIVLKLKYSTKEMRD